jgi:hypothetical protein
MPLPQAEDFDLLSRHPSRRYRIGRNASYRASLRNGFLAGIWWIPATLMLLLRSVLVPVVIGLGWALAIVLLLAFQHAVWLFAGIFGFLIKKDDL